MLLIEFPVVRMSPSCSNSFKSKNFRPWGNLNLSINDFHRCWGGEIQILKRNAQLWSRFYDFWELLSSRLTSAGITRWLSWVVGCSSSMISIILETHFFLNEIWIWFFMENFMKERCQRSLSLDINPDMSLDEQGRPIACLWSNTFEQFKVLSAHLLLSWAFPLNFNFNELGSLMNTSKNLPCLFE